MTQWISSPPHLRSISQCSVELDFQPLTAWPQSLPALAINSYVVAGFQQELAFDHKVDLEDKQKMADLFKSVHSEISFAECAKLIKLSQNLDWFPINEILGKLGWHANQNFFSTAEKLVQAPIGFQKWCAEKKLGPMDLAPLNSIDIDQLKFIFLDILNLEASKNWGTKALELGTELILLGKNKSDIQAQNLLKKENLSRQDLETWVQALETLRFPETQKRDQTFKDKLTALPWPGSSQAKWTRHGDQSGVELKLFVTQPADLKKYLNSLEKVNGLLENMIKGTEH